MVGRGWWCSPGTPLPNPNLAPFGKWWHARGKEYCRGELGLSGEYAPDSARTEGNSIVDGIGRY